MSDEDAWIFQALDLACEPRNIARMLAILDEGLESHLPPGEAGLRVASEFSATEERALYTVLWWVTSRRRDAGARALKELAFHADLRDRLLKMSSSAAPGTIADIDNAIFEQALEAAAANAKISVDLARTIFETGVEASAKF